MRSTTAPRPHGQKSHLKAHTVSKHIESEGKAQNKSERELMKCDTCKYETNRGLLMNRHIKAVHLQIKDHVCEICGFATSQKGHLKVHKNTVHRVQKYTFKCDKCSFSSDIRKNLQRHFQYRHIWNDEV